ncbi:MAG TPA: C40 family peptidase [Gemmatimonadaceae bacterium]|nr:C40 family peptidase [Gemmatimonadaceae bacterium]
MIPGLTAPGHATIRASIAPMYNDPYVASVQISQRLCGHEVELLEQQDDWFRARGVDGYEGWIHFGFLSPAPTSNARRSMPVPRVSLGCVTRAPNGARRRLPLGARLSPEESVKSGEAINETEMLSRFPPEPVAITRSAQELFESTPYLWGGTTPWGADCSGFVQSIFWLHGVQLPRDAWQQSESGTDAGGLMDLKPADLAFFSDREDRRVTHVAIALGGRHLVHLALGRGGFSHENLDASDPYVAKLKERFLRARRVVG